MQFRIRSTTKREVIDITDYLGRDVRQGQGVMHVFMEHTTAAITTANLDPGTDLDFIEFLDAIIPDVPWRHAHKPNHAPDHILASIIGPHLAVPFRDGKLCLGMWQRVVVVDFDGPKERTLELMAFTAAAEDNSGGIII